MASMRKLLVGVALLIATVVCSTEALPTTSSKEDFVCTTEQHRPRYHFSAKKNWINDPNGMVYYNGLYHLFFQHNPDDIVWGPMHWGHAVSRDMATWEHLPIALYPDDVGAIFSGSSVVDFGNTTGFKNSSMDPVVAIYTSAGGTQTQSLAYSLDGGMTFAKYPGNPVLNATETFDFRDPKVRFHDGQWVMTLAVCDRVEFYVSPDLKSWTKESEIGRNPPVGSHDGFWECPDLLNFNVELPNNQTMELWVLFVSISNGSPNGGSGTFYLIGNFTENINGTLEFRELPWTQNQWIDFGFDNYAGVTFSNEPQGRQIYMGWISNVLYSGDTPNIAHRGHFTVPRQLGLRVLNHTAGEYRLTSNPVPELTALRNPLQNLERNESLSMAPQTIIRLTDQANFTTPLMDLEINLEMRGSPKFSICANNDVNEEVCFGYNGERWHLDRTKSGNIDFHDNFKSHLNAYGPREITEDSTNIRIFLDVSSLEVYADDGLTVMTALHFPTRPFDKFYINHWSEAGSQAVVTVNNYRISGLDCWFPENEEA